MIKFNQEIQAEILILHIKIFQLQLEEKQTQQVTRVSELTGRNLG